MPKERMDCSFSVFNGHINEAHQKTMAELFVTNKDWYREIDVAYQNGIMSIFEVEPTPATSAYMMLVTYLVNEIKQ